MNNGDNNKLMMKEENDINLLKLLLIREQEIDEGDFIEQSKVFEKIEKENPWLKK